MIDQHLASSQRVALQLEGPFIRKAKKDKSSEASRYRRIRLVMAGIDDMLAWRPS